MATVFQRGRSCRQDVGHSSHGEHEEEIIQVTPVIDVCAISEHDSREPIKTRQVVGYISVNASPRLVVGFNMASSSISDFASESGSVACAHCHSLHSCLRLLQVHSVRLQHPRRSWTPTFHCCPPPIERAIYDSFLGLLNPPLRLQLAYLSTPCPGACSP